MQINQSSRLIFSAGIILALLAVLIGAFGAHQLKTTLTEYSLSIYEVGARYQMYHALGLCLCGVLSVVFNASPDSQNPWFARSALSFILGVCLFSGSLYVLALTQIKWIGAITPVGGIFLIIGWLLLLVAIFKR